MNHPFFVYGTLKPGEPNYARFLVGRTVGEEPASFVGAAIFSAGHYPCLATAPDLAGPDERVVGTIIRVADADYAAITAQLDKLEGYAEGGTENWYERLLVTVETIDGPRTAWIYVAGAAIESQIRAGGMPKIADGNWQSDPAHQSMWSEQ